MIRIDVDFATRKLGMRPSDFVTKMWALGFSAHFIRMRLALAGIPCGPMYVVDICPTCAGCGKILRKV